MIMGPTTTGGRILSIQRVPAIQIIAAKRTYIRPEIINPVATAAKFALELNSGSETETPSAEMMTVM